MQFITRRSNRVARSVRSLLIAAGIAAAITAGGVSAWASPGTGFTYQGRLLDNGAPANGTYDLQLRLFNSGLGGLQQGPTVLLNDQVVSNGIFTASVDFGARADGKALWMQIDVRPGASAGVYSPIFPRTKLEATPYAQGLSLPVTQSSNAASGLLSFTNDSTNDTAFVMKLTSADPSGIAPGIAFQPVLILDTNDGNGLATYTSRSSAYAGYFSSSGTGSSGLVVINSTPGSGTGLRSDLTSVTSSGNALDSGTVGVGRAGFFSVSNTSNAANALEIQTNGNANSQALRSLHTGLGDNGLFQIINAANEGEAVEATTNGLGNAGLFVSSNSASEVPALFASSVGDGDSIPSGTQLNGIAIRGEGNGLRGIGVSGKGATAGVFGSASTGGAGIYGRTTGGFTQNGITAGVRGDGNGAGTSAVAGFNNLGTAIYGQSSGNNNAGFFSGNVTVTGDLQVNGSKNFKIDHPLDPANKYLIHAAIESNEMKNIYDGVAVIGADGMATVTLPSYFGALNVEYRYQLTCIGGHAPVFVAEEISKNQFKIGGGKPGMKVSWQVTGVRNDAAAVSRPLQVELDKVGSEIGKYINPEAFGQPVTKSIDSMAGTKVPAMN
jgi:hypothetical protein